MTAFRPRPAALAEHGVRHGDRMLVHARNSNAVLETMFAAWMIGAVWVPTNFRLTPPEVAYLAQSSGATVHIFDMALSLIMPSPRDLKTLPAVWKFRSVAATATTGRRMPLSPTRLMLAGRCRVAMIQPGSSIPQVPRGDPKAAVLTHGQMDYVVCNHLCDLMPGTTEQDASLVVAPLSHGAGIHALPQIARGAATILLSGERLDCEEAWRLVERHRVTNMFTVPTILTMLTPTRIGRSL